MKNKQQGWRIVWWSVGLMAANLLLMQLVRAPEIFGWKGFLYYAVILLLCAADAAAVYLLIRKLVNGKK